MTTKQFVAKALEGGWRYENPELKQEEDILEVIGIEDILLDPLAWEAVGKVEGWESKITYKDRLKYEGTWLGYMHAMIDALAEGKSISEFLETL